VTSLRNSARAKIRDGQGTRFFAFQKTFILPCQHIIGGEFKSNNYCPSGNLEDKAPLQLWSFRIPEWVSGVHRILHQACKTVNYGATSPPKAP
jgi:hypothetical protein